MPNDTLWICRTCMKDLCATLQYHYIYRLSNRVRGDCEWCRKYKRIVLTQLVDACSINAIMRASVIIDEIGPEINKLLSPVDDK